MERLRNRERILVFMQPSPCNTALDVSCVSRNALLSASFGETTGNENSATGKVSTKTNTECSGGAMAQAERWRQLLVRRGPRRGRRKTSDYYREVGQRPVIQAQYGSTTKASRFIFSFISECFLDQGVGSAWHLRYPAAGIERALNILRVLWSSHVIGRKGRQDIATQRHFHNPLYTALGPMSAPRKPFLYLPGAVPMAFLNALLNAASDS